MRSLGRLSRSGRVLSRNPLGVRSGEPPRAFRPGIPALDEFPFGVWNRLMMKHWRRQPVDLLPYSTPAGYRPLREAIAQYVAAARAVKCDAEQIVIVSGAQQALDLAARLLLDPGDEAWMEDPGYGGARAALLAAGVKPVAVPVDDAGLDVVAGQRLSPKARLAYVTPSHQYPTGVVMTLARRLELLRWAERSRGWIVEDDYDSEYRYASRPVASLQGLDTSKCVIYCGTFSKVLFPSLRLGYVIVPPQLVDAFGTGEGGHRSPQSHGGAGGAGRVHRRRTHGATCAAHADAVSGAAKHFAGRAASRAGRRRRGALA